MKAFFSKKSSSIVSGSDTREIKDKVSRYSTTEVSKAEVACQNDIPQRTIGTVPDRIQMWDISCDTEKYPTADSYAMTEPSNCKDVFIQTSSSVCDAAVDPGEWNRSILRGIDTQTDSPDPRDPLFWISGTREQVSGIVRDLLCRLDSDMMSDSLTRPKDELELFADNVLLRMEITELRRRLQEFSRFRISQEDDVRISRSSKNLISSLTSGADPALTFIVDAEEGVDVTSSLAPSSSILGHLTKGDRILTAGSPERIGDIIRGPVLPRGWVTLRDSNRIYLRKP